MTLWEMLPLSSFYTRGVEAWRVKQLDHTAREWQRRPLQSHVPGFKHSVVIQSVTSASAWIWTGTHSHGCVTLTGLFLSRDLPHPINEDFVGLFGWLDDSGPMLPTVLAQS